MPLSKNSSKILLITFFVIVAIVSAISLVVYWVVSNHISEDYYKTLKIRADVIGKLELDHVDSIELVSIEEIQQGLSDKLVKEKDLIIPVHQPGLDSRKIEDSLSLPSGFIEEILVKQSARFKKRNRYNYGLLYTANGQPSIIVSSAENITERKIGAYIQTVSIFAIVAITLLSFVIIFYFIRRVSRPISSITRRVKLISTENLHLRIEEPQYNAELSELVSTFNDMINRLETSFETQNNFISNASHELRTPLTAIIGASEVCLSKERSSEEYIETIQVILEEAEKLDHKTKALLNLAQTGFDGKVQKFETVRIDQLLWEVKETVDKLQSDNQVVLDLSLLPDNPMKLKINGNNQLLLLAITNIVMNACKYSNNDVVMVSIGSTEEKVFIVINDKGIGIPEDELAYIYDPFFRASNTGKFHGYGIGLPLAKNIITMHKGTLHLNSNKNQGTIVQIQLPLKKF